GPDEAANVIVTDPLPGSVSFVSAGPGCTGTLGTVTCTLGTLGNGANKQRTITVTPNSVGTITNTASVSSDTADPDAGNNSGSVTSQVVAAASADLSLSKLASPDPLTLGQPLSPSTTLFRSGPDEAANVIVTDPLPGSVSFVSAGP